MKNQLWRNGLTSLILLIILVLAAFMPGTVFAEGDIPEAPLPDPVLEPAPEPAAASAVQTLAENNAVIVEESGAFVPLASQKALAGLSDPDPWYYCTNCAGGKATYVGVNSLSTALADWGTKKGYGFIYLEGGYVHNAFLGIDGAMPGRNTLKGIVWDKTTPGAKPRLDAQTYIYSFNNGFILQGISMTANSAGPSLQLFSNKGTIRLTDVDVKNIGGGGIEVYNQGNIILNGVIANQSKGTGASLVNTYYDSVLEKYINQGGITVTNSEFILNGGPADTTNYVGLTVYTAGNVLISGVAANRNYGNGATISALGASVVVKNSTFSNNTAVPDNAFYGHRLWITPSTVAAVTLDNVSLNNNENSGAILATTSNILLKNINASYNGGNGVLISTGPSYTALGAKNVVVQNSNFFRNTLTGLEMYVSGAVKVTNFTSTHTTSGYGLYIDNRTHAILPVPVTISGAVLTNNFQSGLIVESKGNITVAGITALKNGFTSSLSNQFANATGSVVVSGSLGLNRFNENSSSMGLAIATFRNVTISSIQANGNAYSGLDISANGSASNVTIVGAEINGNAWGGTSPGLWIRTTGNVILNRVTASSNSRQGIFIDNDAASTPKPVLISNTEANNNSREGIVVFSVGAISLNNVTASGNSLSGATLSNQTTTLLPQGVTVQKSTFDGNGYRGLLVESPRQVTLVSVNASYNASNGIRINNNFGGSTSPIVISGTNRFIGNGLVAASNGVTLVTNGALTLSGITVSWSSFNGIGATSGALQNTLRNIVVQGNNQNGIHLITSGNTLLNGITSIQNGQDGLRIFATNAKVTIANSLVVGNGVYGLSLDVTTPATDVYVAPSTVIIGNVSGNYNVY